MARLASCVCILLALSAVVSADIWPAGAPADGAPVLSPRRGTISPQDGIGDSTCYASRLVTASPKGSAPLNAQCPPAADPNANLCTVPDFCPPNSTDPLCPANEYSRYDGVGVEDHFTNQPPGFTMVNAKTTPYSCVDARGQEPMLGTPGGDLSELMNAAMAVMKLSNKPYTPATMDDIADDVFDAFVTNVASPSRPLYFHTDDGSLRKLFFYLKDKLPSMPTILPFKGPDDTATQNIWLEALTRFEYNGCGHIRLQLNPAYSTFYSILKTTGATTTVQDCVGAVAGNCIDSSALAKRVITNFYKYWWFSPSGSPQRQKIAFAVEGILVGPLLGKAVVIVKNKPDAGAVSTCADHAPAVKPTFGGSKVFVYHADAVTTWRTSVSQASWLAPVLTKYGISTSTTGLSTFNTVWQKISEMQLGATLTYLKPANAVGLFQVDVPVSTNKAISTQNVVLEAGGVSSTGLRTAVVGTSEVVPASPAAVAAALDPAPTVPADVAVIGTGPLALPKLPTAVTIPAAGR